MSDETQPDKAVDGEPPCGHPLADGRHTCQRPRGHEGIHYPGSAQATQATHDRSSQPQIDLGLHWIETTSHRDLNATNWLVKRGSEILKVGEVRDDPTGNRAFEAAAQWVSANLPGVDFNWKHWSGISERD